MIVRRDSARNRNDPATAGKCILLKPSRGQSTASGTQNERMLSDQILKTTTDRREQGLIHTTGTRAPSFLKIRKLPTTTAELLSLVPSITHLVPLTDTYPSHRHSPHLPSKDKPLSGAKGRSLGVIQLVGRDYQFPFGIGT